MVRQEAENSLTGESFDKIWNLADQAARDHDNLIEFTSLLWQDAPFLMFIPWVSRPLLLFPKNTIFFFFWLFLSIFTQGVVRICVVWQCV